MKRMPIMTLAAAALAAGLAFGPAVAQDAEEAVASDTRRISRLIVYGNDPCPESTAEEIVVCARRTEDERYRIPEPLRGNSRVSDNRSWATNARSLETVGATGIQSCSTVGPGGYTGCWAEMMRGYRGEENATPEGDALQPD